MKHIGIVDADILDNGSRHPNLTCLKIAGYYNQKGDNVELIDDWDKIKARANEYDHIFVSRVFDFTQIPFDIAEMKNVSYGGTGFAQGFHAYPVSGNHVSPDAIEHAGFISTLPDAIEHTMPYYSLYDKFVEKQIANGAKPSKYKDYMNSSIGFTTRGCFRHCAFCINKTSNGVKFHAHVEEFFDQSRKIIYLWDDNILAYPKWRTVFEELAETKRRFQFRQGMDIRIMTPEKATVLSNSKYYGDYIFAFDHLEQKEQIERGLDVWRQYNSRIPKLYIITGWDSQDEKDIEGAFERIKILMQHRALPYIMRHEKYKNSKYKGMYINLARWCNQPSIFKKKSFYEFCEMNGTNSSTMRYAEEFRHDFPEIADKYYHLRFDKLSGQY